MAYEPLYDPWGDNSPYYGPGWGYSGGGDGGWGTAVPLDCGARGVEAIPAWWPSAPVVKQQAVWAQAKSKFMPSVAGHSGYNFLSAGKRETAGQVEGRKRNRTTIGPGSRKPRVSRADRKAGMHIPRSESSEPGFSTPIASRRVAGSSSGSRGRRRVSLGSGSPCHWWDM